MTRDQDSMTGDLDMMDASPNMSCDAGSPHANIDGYGEEEDGDDASSSANSENKSLPHPNMDLQANAAATRWLVCKTA